jgi:hypothetical protein
MAGDDGHNSQGLPPPPSLTTAVFLPYQYQDLPFIISKFRHLGLPLGIHLNISKTKILTLSANSTTAPLFSPWPSMATSKTPLDSSMAPPWRSKKAHASSANPLAHTNTPNNFASLSYSRTSKLSRPFSNTTTSLLAHHPTPCLQPHLPQSATWVSHLHHAWWPG